MFERVEQVDHNWLWKIFACVQASFLHNILCIVVYRKVSQDCQSFFHFFYSGGGLAVKNAHLRQMLSR